MKSDQVGYARIDCKIYDFDPKKRAEIVRFHPRLHYFLRNGGIFEATVSKNLSKKLTLTSMSQPAPALRQHRNARLFGSLKLVTTKVMRMRYRMFRRGNVFWSHDGETGKQESLGTKDRREAEKVLHAKNEPHRNAALSLQIGRAYLAASDPKMMTRTWHDVMQEIRHAPSRTAIPLTCRIRQNYFHKPLDGF